MPERAAPGGRGIRTEDATGGSSYHPLDCSHELSTAVPEGIGGRDPIFLLIRSHGSVPFLPRPVLLVYSHAYPLPPPRRAPGELKPPHLLLHHPQPPCHDRPAD